MALDTSARMADPPSADLYRLRSQVSGAGQIMKTIEEFELEEADKPVSEEEIRASREDQAKWGLPVHLLPDEAIIRIIRVERAGMRYVRYCENVQ